jgi:hypothetical protein
MKCSLRKPFLWMMYPKAMIRNIGIIVSITAIKTSHSGTPVRRKGSRRAEGERVRRAEGKKKGRGYFLP